jgi:ureidoacrylate peracid hydrolase
MSAGEMHLAALRVMALTSSRLIATDEFLARLP